LLAENLYETIVSAASLSTSYFLAVEVSNSVARRFVLHTTCHAWHLFIYFI